MRRPIRDERGLGPVDTVLVSALVVLGVTFIAGIKIFVIDEDLGPQAQVGNTAQSVDDSIWQGAPPCDAAKAVAAKRGIVYTNSDGWRLAGQPAPLFDGNLKAWNAEFAAYRGKVLAIVESDSLVTDMKNECTKGQDLGAPKDKEVPTATTLANFAGTYAVEVQSSDCKGGTPTSLIVSGSGSALSVNVVYPDGTAAVTGSAPSFNGRLDNIAFGVAKTISVHLAGRFEATGTSATFNEGLFEVSSSEGEACQARFTARR